MDYYRACARLTCRHFDISAQTIYRWLQRYRPGDLTTLESRSRRPRRLRQPSWSAAPEQAVLKLRWGKDKLAVLLRAEGCAVSVSMVGRILTRPKRRGGVGRGAPDGSWHRAQFPMDGAERL
jgi:transposase